MRQSGFARSGVPGYSGCLPAWRGPRASRCPVLGGELTGAAAGMGVSTVTAARILKGQLRNGKGEESLLEMDKFPYVALAKVSPTAGTRARS